MNSVYCMGIYLRVSKEDEGEELESNSIRNQRELLYQFIKEKPEFATCKVEEFVDDGYSGTNFYRPGIQRLLDGVKKKEIHCILVKDFSRFGRNYIEIGEYLEQIFPFLGVRFISINDRYDSGRGEGQGLDMAIKNLLYDLYSKDLSKKIVSALEIKKGKGDFLGTSPPYGYKKDKNKKKFLVVDKEAAEIIKRIYTLTIEGKRRTEIARDFNKEGITTPGEYLRMKHNHNMWQFSEEKPMWTAQTIGRILRNPVYIGVVINSKYKRKEIGSSKKIKLSTDSWKVNKEAHEPIISVKDFILAQDTFQIHRKRKESYERKDSLRGIFRCGNCKYLMESRNKGYFCDYKRFTGSDRCKDAVALEDEMIEGIFFILNQYALLINEKKVKKSTLLEIEDEKHIKRQIKRWKTAYLSCYEDYKRERLSLEGYVARKAEISNILDKLKEKEITLQEINRESYSSSDKKIINKKEILQGLVSNVWVYSSDRIEIDFLT